MITKFSFQFLISCKIYSEKILDMGYFGIILLRNFCEFKLSFECLSNFINFPSLAIIETFWCFCTKENNPASLCCKNENVYPVPLLNYFFCYKLFITGEYSTKMIMERCCLHKTFPRKKHGYYHCSLLTLFMSLMSQKKKKKL